MQKMYFVSLLALMFSSSAQAQSLPSLETPKPFRFGPSWHPTNYSWVKKPWVRDDARIIEVKKYIDAAIQRHEVTKQTITDYEVVYHKTPSDLVAVFQWAYAAHHGGRKTLNDGEQYYLNRAVDEALAQLKTPYTCETAQLRFLIEAEVFPDPKLAFVGERLLAAEPKNRSVKAQTAFFLSWSRDTAIKTKGLKYAKELLRDYPSEPKYHDLVGRCYDAFCWLTKNPEYAAKAIAEYRIFQRSLPPSDDDRRIIDIKVKRLQDGGGPESLRRELPAVPKAKP